MKVNSCNLPKFNYKKLLFLAVFIAILWKSTALECFSCDSNDDIECATKPGQQLHVEECATDNDECVQVVVGGVTKRGCLSRLFPNRFCPAPCSRCQKSLCNRDVFPADRKRCYQCSGTECVNVDKKANLLLPCPFYKEEDRCYMNVIHSSNVLRGCESTMDESKECPHACIRCNRDGCNNEPGMTLQNCLECTHSLAKPDPWCWRGQEETAGKCVTKTEKYCQNKNLYGHEGKCYYFVNEQTGVVQRGCSSNKPSLTTGVVKECYGEKCNTDCVTISCNVCSSDDQIGCREGKFLKTEKCEENTQSCFTCEMGNRVTRGCADKKFYARIANSFSSVQNEACYLCRDSNGCNRSSVRSCYSCSSMEDKDCALMSMADSIATRNCSSYEDLCVSTVVTKVQHNYALRGCASHLAECTENDALCVRCNGSLCNNVPIDLSSVQVANYPATVIQGNLVAVKSAGVLNRSFEFMICIFLIVIFVI